MSNSTTKEILMETVTHIFYMDGTDEEKQCLKDAPKFNQPNGGLKQYEVKEVEDENGDITLIHNAPWAFHLR